MRILIIDWAKFVPAILLLLTPVALLENRRVQFRGIDREWSQHRGRMAALWLHYFDLVRAAVGVWLLNAAMQPAADAGSAARYAMLFAPGVVQLVAVLLQTVICKEPESANAPFMFVAGLLLGGPSPLAAAMALILAVALAMGSRTPSAFFPVLGAGFAATSALFGGKGLILRVVVAAFAVTLPWLWSLLFRRDLLAPYRSHHTPRTHAPSHRSPLK